MRHGFTMLLAILILAPNLSADSRHSWNAVEALKPGTFVQVEMWSKKSFRGRIDSVSDSQITLVPDSYGAGSPLPARAVGREEIRRVFRVHEAPHLPNPLVCAVAGALSTGLALGIEEGIEGGAVGAMFGGGVGALGGALLGEMACGVVGIVKAMPALAHPRSLIYRADGLPAPQSTVLNP
jgi:hypothetical protein